MAFLTVYPATMLCAILGPDCFESIDLTTGPSARPAPPRRRPGRGPISRRAQTDPRAPRRRADWRLHPLNGNPARIVKYPYGWVVVALEGCSPAHPSPRSSFTAAAGPRSAQRPSGPARSQPCTELTCWRARGARAASPSCSSLSLGASLHSDKA